MHSEEMPLFFGVYIIWGNNMLSSRQCRGGGIAVFYEESALR